MQNKGFLVALLAPVMALAQGHHGGDHDGPRGGGHPTSPTRPIVSGTHYQPTISTGIHLASGPPSIGLQSQPGIYTGINSGAYGTSGFHGGIGRGGGEHRRPVLYGLPYFPVSGYYQSESAAYAPQPDTSAEQSAEVNANILGEQVERLTAEVEALRNERQQPAFSSSAPMQPAPVEPATPPITLVLRGGKSLQLKSYAVMNGEIWDLSGQTSRRIPLASIDLPASQTATETAGGVFPSVADQH